MNEEKSIVCLLTEIVDKICESYCKYPDMCPDDKELSDEYCAKCPLTKIG